MQPITATNSYGNRRTESGLRVDNDLEGVQNWKHLYADFLQNKSGFYDIIRFYCKLFRKRQLLTRTYSWFENQTSRQIFNQFHLKFPNFVFVTLSCELSVHRKTSTKIVFCPQNPFRSLRCRGLHGGSSCGAIQRVRRTLKGEKGEGGRKGERTNVARGKGKRKRRRKERETGAMRLEQGGLDVGRPARARTTALGRFSSFYSFHLDWPPASSSRRGLPCLQPRPSVSIVYV